MRYLYGLDTLEYYQDKHGCDLDHGDVVHDVEVHDVEVHDDEDRDGEDHDDDVDEDFDDVDRDDGGEEGEEYDEGGCVDVRYPWFFQLFNFIYFSIFILD